MRHSHRGLAGFLIAVVLLLPACDPVEEEVDTGKPQARIEPIEGTDLVRVILTPEAAERLDMQVASVRDASNAGGTGGAQLVIPYASVFYGLNGETWTYTNPETLTFERAPIEIDRIEGDLVFLESGPPSGTAVVTLGAAELFGIETGVDES